LLLLQKLHNAKVARITAEISFPANQIVEFSSIVPAGEVKVKSKPAADSSNEEYFDDDEEYFDEQCRPEFDDDDGCFDEQCPPDFDDDEEYFDEQCRPEFDDDDGCFDEQCPPDFDDDDGYFDDEEGFGFERVAPVIVTPEVAAGINWKPDL
ncbi:hypothetical protein, partial [Cylindrospermopsis raciborskii]|uniref:hypothetical protein n=1 Tax=Cylindrospermopsis raciborskii TaxID=77022 RepID=UPI0022C95F4E